MTTITYRVLFSDNRGSFASDAFASDAFAASCEGVSRNCVERFDGERDLALIDLPEENAELLEALLESDSNVLAYTAQ